MSPNERLWSRPSRTVTRISMFDGQLAVIGDIAICRDGDELLVIHPSAIPILTHDQLGEPQNACADLMARNYCGPWRINGVSGCFAKLADAAQQAEVLFNRDDPFARPIVVYDKWGDVAYVPKREST